MIIETSIFQHPKYKRLRRRIGYAAMHFLTSIWAYCQANKSVELGKVDADWVESLVDWDGDSGVLWTALTEKSDALSAWLDVDESTGIVTVHDWLEWNNGLVSRWNNGSHGGRKKRQITENGGSAPHSNDAKSGKPNCEFGYPNSESGKPNCSFGFPNEESGQPKTPFTPPFGYPNSESGNPKMGFGGAASSTLILSPLISEGDARGNESGGAVQPPMPILPSGVMLSDPGDGTGKKTGSVQDAVAETERREAGFAHAPTLEEFRAHSALLGVPGWFAERKWLAREEKGWHGTQNWTAYARIVLGWWVDDGRPVNPPNKKNGAAGSAVAEAIARKDRMRELERFVAESPCNQGEGTAEDRRKLKEARRQIAELRELVAFGVKPHGCPDAGAQASQWHSELAQATGEAKALKRELTELEGRRDAKGLGTEDLAKLRQMQEELERLKQRRTELIGKINGLQRTPENAAATAAAREAIRPAAAAMAGALA